MFIPITVPTDSGNANTVNSAQTILFADDNEDFRRAVAALLYKCGYRVITASDGNDALQKAREFNGAIHLLLSDIEMPGMSGIELSSQLNHERPDTRILLISGVDSGLPVVDNGWQFLRKPFAFATLLDGIRAFLGDQTLAKI